MKRVAIIGAGSSGLVCAKYALENDLLPVVYESSNQVGGLWSAKDTAIWEGLHSNISKYTIYIIYIGYSKLYSLDLIKFN